MENSQRDADVLATAGALKALEYGIRALIACHPDPKGFESAWKALLVEIADAHAGRGLGVHPEFQAAMQSVLGRLSDQAAIAARSAPDVPG